MRDIVDKVRRAGVVGAGGAGFPTHVKLSSQADSIIINASECEPLLAVDRLLVERYADRLVSTARLLSSRMGAKNVFFAIKRKYEKAVALLHDLIGDPARGTRNAADVRLALLDDVYPAGDEHVALYEVLGRVIPEGGIPPNVGALVLNVETLLNVAFALEDRPVTHTYCTISGSVAQPLTMRLPVGMSVREAIGLAGVFSENTHLVLEGGPMMGRLVADWSEPLTKTTKGLIILPREHYLATRYSNVPREIGKNIVSICCSCLQCTEACPRYLLGHTIEPHKLMVAAASGLEKSDRIFQMAHYCCECGVCELWACFMFLSPRQLIADIRRDLARKGIKRLPFKKSFQPHPAREYRTVHASRLKWRLQISEFDRTPRFRDDDGFPVSSVLIPLTSYSGKPTMPIVKTGERVRIGTPLSAPAEGALGAVAHSSIDGTVTEVNERFVRIRKR